MLKSWLCELLQLRQEAWFAKQHYLHVFSMQGFDSQIKTLLETYLKRHRTDLGEFVELFYNKSACSFEPYKGTEAEKNPYEKPTCPYPSRFTEE